MKVLDQTGLNYFWGKIKETITSEVDTVEDKIGTVTTGKTVVQMVSDAETNAKAYADGLALEWGTF